MNFVDFGSNELLEIVLYFNSIYLKNVFINHIFNIYVKTRLRIKLTIMVDMSSNQTKSSQTASVVIIVYQLMPKIFLATVLKVYLNCYRRGHKQPAKEL